MAIEKAFNSSAQLHLGEDAVNILEVIGNASFGGMEQYVINFLTHLPSNNYRITCICPYESSFTSSLRDLGYPVYITPISDDPVWRSIQFASQIVYLHKIDVLHAHMPKAHTLAAIAGNLVNKPVVSSVHGMHFSSYEYGVTRLAKSHLITNCQEAYGQALGLGVAADQVSVIHNGVDVQLFSPNDSDNEIRILIDIPQNAPIIGFVGRLAYEKGPDMFLRAAQYIHFSRPDVHFVVVGKGDMEDELKKMCILLGLEKHVHFIGWQTKMASVYRSFDALIYASRSDGTSLVLLEAMACGCPAVGLDVGGIREIIENGSTGILVPPLNWQNISHHVLELLANPVQLKRMGLEARMRVQNNFDLTSKTQATCELLRQVALGSIKEQKGLSGGLMVPINSSGVSLNNVSAEL